jgi:cytochrome c biogenesis protein CcdA
MSIITFMEIMGTSGIPLVAAFFIGLMTAMSPCPMATNITAIAAVSKRIGEKRRTLLVGVSYTLGRAFTYAGIASLIVWAGLSSQSLSLFLQSNGESFIGPFLIVLGILMIAIAKFPVMRGTNKLNALKENLAGRGYLGGFLLGAVFALAFCPFSAVLFFGMLIPLALAAGDGIMIPSIFAIGTGLPVIIFSIILSHSVSKVAKIIGKIEVIDKWMLRAVSLIFIIVGVYYTFIIHFT